MKKCTVILLTIGIILSSLALPTYETEQKDTLRTFSNTCSIDSDRSDPTTDRN